MTYKIFQIVCLDFQILKDFLNILITVDSKSLFYLWQSALYNFCYWYLARLFCDPEYSFGHHFTDILRKHTFCFSDCNLV